MGTPASGSHASGSKPRSRAWWRGTVLAGAIGAAFVVASHAGKLDALDFAWLDSLFYLRGSRLPTDDIRIVAIGESDFAAFGYEVPPPQMPRAPLADAIRRLADAEARVIVVDLILDGPSAGPGGAGDDARLAEALRHAQERGTALVLAAILVGSAGDARLAEPLAEFRKHARTGLASVVTSSDGVVRAFLPGVSVGGTDVPALAYRAAHLFETERRDRASPTGKRQMLIDFRGPPGTFAALPLKSLVDGALPPEWFTGRIVLIGRTDHVGGDQHPVPPIGHTSTAAEGSRTDLMDGVEIHANAISTLLGNRGLTRTTLLGDLLVQLVIAGVAAWFGLRWGTIGALGSLVGLCVVAVPLSVLLLASASYWLNLAPVGLALVAHTALVELGERRRLGALFGPYVGPSMLRQLWRKRDELQLGGEERNVSLLVFDIRDSTTAAERIAPTRVGDLLNHLFAAVAPAIWAHGGAVNKYLGDGFLATFNAPMDQADHADAAVRAAIDAVRGAARVAPEWRRVTGHDLVAYAAVHTGRVMVGNVGSPKRMEYTAIGDNVNVAFRMMDSCKEHDALIQISEATQQACEKAWPGARFEVRLRGRPGEFVLCALQGYQMSRFQELVEEETQ
jgi:adenylate cyclase